MLQTIFVCSVMQIIFAEFETFPPVNHVLIDQECWVMAGEVVC